MEVKPRSQWSWHRFWSTGGSLALVVLGAAAAGSGVAASRAIPPSEMPGLRLDAGAVEAVRATDRARAASVPSGDEVDAFRALFLEQGRAEWTGEPESLTESRRAKLRERVAKLRGAHGDDVLTALRAEAVERLAAAFEGSLEPAEREGRLGSYPRILERYGLAREGRWIAPDFVVRTLYKARWNAIVGLPFTEGFAKEEGLAYYGWLALHATGADPSLRAEALESYAALGGDRVDEARGTLSFRTGQLGQAAFFLAKALESEGSIRLRNHWLAAVEETGAD